MVEVNHNRDSRHKEEQEGDPTAPLVPRELEKQSEKPQKQRQHIVVVLAFVLLEIVRCIALVAEPYFVYERDSAFPVTLENLSRARAVNVVLATGEVPHEVAPVHPVQLIVKKETEVFAHCRLAVVSACLASVLHIIAVELLVTVIDAVSAVPHARKKHLVAALIDDISE